MPPLRWLAIERAQRLAAGSTPYTVPKRLAVTAHWLFVVPAGDPLATALFALPGQTITEAEAFLAGGAGREGVEENLAMILAVLDAAGATPEWATAHVDVPGTAAIVATFGRGPGRPPNAPRDYVDARHRADRLRKRWPALLTRGRTALESQIGPTWRDVLVR